MATGLRSVRSVVVGGRASMALIALVMSSGGCSGEEAAPGRGAARAGASGIGADAGGGIAGPSTDELGGAAAARTTADTNASCSAIAPFYWEIGDSGGTLISGSVGATAPAASTVIAIASGSKWLFGAYAVQKMGGMPAATDIPLLNLTSGYIGLGPCSPSGTVDDCLAGEAGVQVAAEVGKFDYGDAHLQKLASLMGLGPAGNAALAVAVKEQIGSELELEYAAPQPGSGVETSAEQYARFLQKLLVGSPTPLLLGALLGSDAVCTNPATCSTAIFSPITGSASTIESWHYGLAHWVEDDPVVGDGAFSSAGAFGFYPWVDATRTFYGVLAREVPATGHNGYDSAACGRSIRKAWVTRVAQ